MRYFPSKVEPKWQKKWLAEKTYEPDFSAAKKPFYNLMMFPYPSAEGLHVGNMYAFTGSDIYGRFKKMQGFDVFEPIGLDGFGIHSENYAIKISKHPADQAKVSEKNFYRQLAAIGNGFAWNERLETYNPDYYKWTQWIFVQMFKRGLAYRKKAAVNWCPSCMTVLADEQVIQKSEIRNSKSETNLKSQTQNHKHEMRFEVCERCDTPVVKKELEQWFFRITDYAERLLRNLGKIDWSEKIKVAQRNWIGKSEGALLKFPIFNSQFSIEVFTTRPDTLFGATYMVLGPEHSLIQNLKLKIQNWDEVERYIKKARTKNEEERIAEGKEKTGVELKGIKAINPANGGEIPVWVADYVLGHVGTGAIMAVPAHDERDYEFAVKFELPVREVIKPADREIKSSKIKIQNDSLKLKIKAGAYEDDGILVNSGKFDGMPSEKAKWEITSAVGGVKKIQYRLRDWLISRQRYWGPPIPIIYCRKCWEIRNPKSEIRNKSKTQNPKLREGIDYAVFGGQEYIIHAVPEEDLPVRLPYIKNFRPTGTDQSPLAADESFYKVQCPVCGSPARRETDVSDTFLDSAWYYLAYLGKENSKFEIRNSKFRQRAKRWLPVDMYIGGAEHAVLHLLYVRFVTMAFYDWGLINFEEPFKKFRAHGLIIKGGAKMSKSRGNVVNPDEYVRAYGADALRMYLMFLGPFEHGGDFRDSGIRGITRFLDRVWRFCQSQLGEIQNPKSKILNKSKIQNLKSQTEGGVKRVLHRTVKKITEDIETLQYNTAISALMILLNAFEENAESVSKDDFMKFLQLLAPFAPHIAEELWVNLGGKESIHLSRWPEADRDLLPEDKKILVIQINGKTRDRVEIDTGLPEHVVRALVLDRPAVRKWMAGKPLKKFIHVPGRIANVVI